MMNALKMAACTAMLAGLLGPAMAQQRGSKEDAIALVRRAVTYASENGAEKTYAEINNPNGKLRERDLYLAVMDQEGRNLAHGGNPRLVGKNLYAMRDVEGKAFIKEMIAVAEKSGKGWVDYQWPHPGTGALERKSTYVERAGSVIYICGSYKQ